ncbi:hypothetical protein B9D94_04395 [Paenibacillus sp. Cedars]|nr:hypothetical protein B9D94_04395 [Paenibacillus sp. Cedars]
MVDGNETFNIETMLNENWDKVDEAVGNIKVPDASLTEKGIVQLSSATNGTRENVAATEKAVKDAALQAKSYTDQQISLVTETGIPKLVSYPLLVTATADNQKVFEIPLDLFDADTDTLLVAINRAALDPTQYTVTNTVRNAAGEVSQRAKITLLSGVASTSEVTMVVLKNVPIGPEGAINGAVLAMDSVPINRVNGLQDQLDGAFQAGNERKAEVVAALVAIGVPASTSETWALLIPKISAVIRATGNATAADVLVGKSASNASGPFNGGMPNRSAENNYMPGLESTVWAGDRFFIKPPHGYYNGTTWVTAAVLGLTANNLRAGVNVAGLVGTLSPGDRSLVTNNPMPKNIPNPNAWVYHDLFTIPPSESYIDVYTAEDNNVPKLQALTMTNEFSTTKTAALVLIDDAGVVYTLKTSTSTGAQVMAQLTGFALDRKQRTGTMYGSGAGGPVGVAMPAIPANFKLTGTLRFCSASMYQGNDSRSTAEGWARSLVVLTA